MFEIRKHPQGPRLFIFGLRIHHGLIGLWMAILGFILIYHDRKDAPWF